MIEKEKCENPWKKECNNIDIEVYIYYKNNKVPICRKCWAEIGESDREWSETNPMRIRE